MKSDPSVGGNDPFAANPRRICEACHQSFVRIVCFSFCFVDACVFFAPFFHALAAIPAGLTNMAGWMASFFLVECSEFERRSAIEALRIKEKEARFAVRVRLLTSLRGYILTNQGEACQNNCQSGGCYDASARCHLVTTQQFVQLRLI